MNSKTSVIVGLGQAGLGMAEQFAGRQQGVSTFVIDSNEQPDGLQSTYIKISPEPNPEAYEENFNRVAVEAQLPNEIGLTLFITSAGAVSGAALQILNILREKSSLLEVIYIKPDRTILSERGILQENLIYHVFQEYTRSGIFDRLYIIKNSKVENAIGGASLFSYYEKINEAIVGTMSTIYELNQHKPLVGTLTAPYETARICSIGAVDLESKEEKPFFDLEMPRENHYYFAFTRVQLETDKNLHRKIVDLLKKKSETDNVKTAYGVYESPFNMSFGYFVSYSSSIQKNKGD